MKNFRRAKRTVDISVGESVRIVRELQGLSQNEPPPKREYSVRLGRQRPVPNQRSPGDMTRGPQRVSIWCPSLVSALRSTPENRLLLLRILNELHRGSLQRPVPICFRRAQRRGCFRSVLRRRSLPRRPLLTPPSQGSRSNERVPRELDPLRLDASPIGSGCSRSLQWRNAFHRLSIDCYTVR